MLGHDKTGDVGRQEHRAGCGQRRRGRDRGPVTVRRDHPKQKAGRNENNRSGESGKCLPTRHAPVASRRHKNADTRCFEKGDAVRKQRRGSSFDGQYELKAEKIKGWPQPEAEKDLGRFLALRPCFRSCRADLKFACFEPIRASERYYQVNAQVRFWETGKYRNSEYAARHSFPGTTMRRVLRFQPHHSKPGAFIAQIAVMKTAFARGRTANVNARAVSGQTVMLTKRGQSKDCHGIQCRRYHQMADNDDCQPCRSVVSMNYAEVLATGGAVFYLMQIAPEELSPTARATLSGYGPSDCWPDPYRQM
jgi:hypothetical protein